MQEKFSKLCEGLSSNSPRQSLKKVYFFLILVTCPQDKQAYITLAGRVLTRKVLLVKYVQHLRQCKRLYARKLIRFLEANLRARVTYLVARIGSFVAFCLARTKSLVISVLAVPCSKRLNLLDI